MSDVESSLSNDSQSGAAPAEVYCCECGDVMYLKEFPEVDVQCQICREKQLEDLAGKMRVSLACLGALSISIFGFFEFFHSVIEQSFLVCDFCRLLGS